MSKELEKKKYSDIWNQHHKSYKSRSCVDFGLYVAKKVFPTDKILDLGCGDGCTAISLRQAGFDCSGLDITLDGLRKYNPAHVEKDFYEGSVWELPFEDNSFNVVISTDLFEHIPPEFLNKAISESIRVCQRQAIHIIASYPERPYCGYDVHLSVYEWDWWIKKFTRAVHKAGKSLEWELKDRRKFDQEIDRVKLNKLGAKK